jgi:ankyrin repeat protein
MNIKYIATVLLSCAYFPNSFAAEFSRYVTIGGVRYGPYDMATLEAPAGGPEHAYSQAFPLHFAAGDGDIELVQELAVNKAKVNSLDENNNTPLHKAAYYGRFANAEELTKWGADIYAKNKKGQTPKEIAMRIARLFLQKKYVEVVEHLQKLEDTEDIKEPEKK